MAIDTRWQSYKDPICQISSLYVIWFHLQALSYLIENKEGNTQKKLKIAISRPNIRIFENETACDDLSSRGSLITKKKPLGQKLLPTRPICGQFRIFDKTGSSFQNFYKW